MFRLATINIPVDCTGILLLQVSEVPERLDQYGVDMGCYRDKGCNPDKQGCMSDVVTSRGSAIYDANINRAEFISAIKSSVHRTP